MSSMSKCRSCGALVHWLKLVRKEWCPQSGRFVVREVPGAKLNPIDARPNRKGRLVIDTANGRYRFATGNEVETASATGRNLYISHFETCPKAADQR